ncbi:hypothetical protein ZIOFF_045122 [Zingiber officinale]|uniref:Uncharacterized protein n=1 Tax=Zingiber officinale TaxID=94328 RepID=A0A8J5L0R9_ZINOF|nr:hypothetical protein ZIOFF_045122 [Zingiber officinale]
MLATSFLLLKKAFLQDSQRTAEVKSSSQASHKIQSKHQSPTVSETLEQDPGQSFILCSNDKKISHEDIGLVQNLIEHCLQLYMNKKEVIRTLSVRAKVEPDFTALVWNIFLNSGTSEAAAPAPEDSAMASMSEMAMRPSPVASNNHFPLTPLELSMGMDSPALGSTFTSDVNVGELETRLDVDFASSRDSTRSLSHIWNFSLSDLTTDCENLDLGAIGDYSGSPFVSFGSDLLLDLPVEDDVVEYFADQISGSSLHSGEDKAYINRAEETN